MDGGAAVAERLLNTEEVAGLFRVSESSVKRWAGDRRYQRQLGAFKTTPRGHYRYPESLVLAALNSGLHVDQGTGHEELPDRGHDGRDRAGG